MATTAGLYDKFSLGATVRSTPMLVGPAKNVSFAVRTSGTAAGTWRLQYSNDFVLGVDDPSVDTKWDEYTLTTNPADAAGAAQKFGIVLSPFQFRWVRLIFTRSGGTGTAEVWVTVEN